MITQLQAYDWLKGHLTGAMSGGMAKITATNLSSTMARWINGDEKLLPDPWNWRERIANYGYTTGYPDALFVAGDGRLVGTWILGNDYRVQSQFYGGYPATYLQRVRALFPDKKKALHLFSGKVDLAMFPGDTVDINSALAMAHPPRTGIHYIDDAQELSRVPLERYDLVLADPPYSGEDAEHYQTSMVNRTKVMRALSRLSPGTYVVWLDQVLPMWRKDTFDVIGVVGIVRSTNHRFRVMTIYRRK